MEKRDKILYIDDEQINLDAFHFAFFRDYDILLAKTIEEAEGFLRKNEIKVVISDQKMPGESGILFIERIKSDFPDIIFILLTAHAEIEVIIDAINTGVIKRYILKPYEKEEMNLAINNAIESYDLKSENRELICQLKNKYQELSDYNQRLRVANENLISREKELEKYSEMLAKRNEELYFTKQKIEISGNQKNDLLLALNKVALVSITDLKGNITQVNSEFCKIAEYNECELLGSTHRIINSGYHTKKFWKKMWTTIRQGNTWRGEVKNVSKNGTAFWTDTVITPVKNSEGHTYEYLAIRYLITDKKILHQQREKLLKDLERYAFITSHKIRGPLSRIMGISMLINRCDISLDDKTETYCHLEKSVRELDDIIREMNKVLNRTSYPIHQALLEVNKF